MSDNNSEPLILWAKDVNKDMVSVVGGKSANLGELYNLDIPIPNCFFITSYAYKHFLLENELWPRIEEFLNKIDYSDTNSIEYNSTKIRELIVNTNMSKVLKKKIVDNYNLIDFDSSLRNSGAGDLLKSMSNGSFVAVRSSATAEDLPEASFAGQQATFLNVKGNENLINSVLKCWASLFTNRAVYYRHKNNFEHKSVYIAVVVQKMVDSKKSGICFTSNPATNNRDEIVIEAGIGLGETIVSGSVSPDNYIVDAGKFEIKNKLIQNQEYALFRDINGGNKKVILGDVEKSKQKLDDDLIINLAQICKKIELHYSKPQDIEFAIDNRKIYIVQSRAITTLKNKSDSSDVKIKESELFSGLAASSGISSGEVVIINSMDDLYKVKKGNVLVTKMTTPDMVPAMEKASAIITDEGGITCHAAIVSRELGVPSVVGTKVATSKLKSGDIVTVNGDSGLIYMGEVKLKQKQNSNNDFQKDLKTKTKIKLILDLPSLAKKHSTLPSDGVGLIRSEFIISKSGVHPVHYLKNNSNDLDLYIKVIYDGLKEIASNFHPRPIWYRTSDLRTDEYTGLIDGDQIKKEDNPMLGSHGIRFSIMHKELLKAEFLAIKKLAEEGLDNISVMLPFVIRKEEFDIAKEIADQINLKNKLGIMCETPASVWIIEDIIKSGAKFISFGTNDLTQLTLGIDRNNEELTSLFSELHPAILKEIEYVINIAKKYDVETSICGQAGSNPEMAKHLIDLGIDSISVNPDAFYKVKETVYNSENK